MADTTYVNYTAPAVNAEWLNEINDHVWHDGPVSGTTVHNASAIKNTPSGNIISTSIQDAINELDTEKLAANTLAASNGSSLVGFKQDGTGAVLRTLESKVKEFVSVKDFGAKGDGVTDDTVAIQAAINTGKRVRVPEGVYKITSTLTSSGKDFILEGDSASVIGEKNNQETNFTGSVITYFGPNDSHVIAPLNTPTTNQISLKNLRVVAPNTLTTSIVKLVGTQVTSNEYSGSVTLSNVAIQTRNFDVASNGLTGYTMTGLEIDCTAGYGFGWVFDTVYIFGVQTGIKVSVSGTGFFNSNTFRSVKQYQVYRALYLYSSGANKQIYANLFDGFYVQPNTQGGTFADGVILIDGDVTQNVFIAPNVFDTNSGQSFKTINNTVRWGKENIFIGAQANDLYAGTITLPGFGIQSDGHFLARMFKSLLDPAKDATMRAMLMQDQADGWIRYPRNGATNDILIGVSGGDKFGVDGATGQKKSVAVGGATLLQEYGCRAWVNFNGATGTIRAGGNVTSITRTGVGRYTVNMTTPMPDRNYCVNPSAGYHTGTTDASYCNADQFANWTTSTFNIVCRDDGGTYFDPDVVCASVFR